MARCGSLLEGDGFDAEGGLFFVGEPFDPLLPDELAAGRSPPFPPASAADGARATSAASRTNERRRGMVLLTGHETIVVRPYSNYFTRTLRTRS
jgi:hypothetical protein